MSLRIQHPSRRRVPAGAALTLCAAFAIEAPPVLAGPPGDYGDAPVGDNGAGIEAYPGVLARWTSFYQHKSTVTSPVQHNWGTWLNPGATFCLGDVPPAVSFDSNQNPGSPDNDATIQLLVNNSGALTLGDLEIRVSTLSGHTGNRFYLNVFIDQNRDGEWKDGSAAGTPLIAWVPEWQVADYPIDIANPNQVVDLTLGPIGLAGPTQDVWVRAIVSDAPIGSILKAGAQFWDTTMTGAHGWVGEVEDHLLNFATSSNANLTAGIKLKKRWRNGNLGGHNMDSCDIKYIGPHRITLVYCAPAPAWMPVDYIGNKVVPLDFLISGRGCPGRKFLVGAWGLEHLEGQPVPPNLFPTPPFPAGNDNWPVGLNAVLQPCGETLRPTVLGYGLMYGGLVTIPNPVGVLPFESAHRGSSGMRVLGVTGCYPYIPGGSDRRYRLHVRSYSCASKYHGLPLAPQPRLPQNLLGFPGIDDIGHPADFVNLNLVDYSERFEIPPAFPNDSFSNYSWTPGGPGAFAFIDNSDFTSSPASNRLFNTIYHVVPGISPDVRTTALTFRYRGSIANVQLLSATGQVLSFIPPFAPGWSTFTTPLPVGYDLTNISIHGSDAWIDDVEITVEVRPDPAPENDNWANAYPLGEGYDVGTTTSATTDGSATCGSSNSTPDTWHRFHATGNALSIDTIGSGFDTVISIHDATPTGPGPAAVCNDQFLANHSRLAVFITPGFDYFLRVSGYNGDSGPYIVDYSYLEVPANDNCVDATQVPDGVWPFDTTLATTDGPLAIGCGLANTTISGDVWYRYIPACNGTATAKTCSSTIFDTQIAVYAGALCPPAASPIVCDDDACGAQSSVTFPTTAGQTYLIRVGSYGNSTRARGTLDIECFGTIPPPCAPDYDQNGILAVADIFAFLSGWFSGEPRADFDGSGLSVSDVFAFLNAWFAGCP